MTFVSSTRAAVLVAVAFNKFGTDSTTWNCESLVGFNKYMANTTHTDHDLMSTARVCELLQTTPRRLMRAAEQSHVEPSLRLNDVAYWSDNAIDAIRAQLGGAK